MRHVRKPLLDCHIIQFIFWCVHQLQQGHSLFLSKSHASHIKNIALLIHQPGLRMCRMSVIEIQYLLCHTSVRIIE